MTDPSDYESLRREIKVKVIKEKRATRDEYQVVFDKFKDRAVEKYPDQPKLLLWQLDKWLWNRFFDNPGDAPFTTPAPESLRCMSSFYPVQHDVLGREATASEQRLLTLYPQVEFPSERTIKLCSDVTLATARESGMKKFDALRKSLTLHLSNTEIPVDKGDWMEMARFRNEKAVAYMMGLLKYPGVWSNDAEGAIRALVENNTGLSVESCWSFFLVLNITFFRIACLDPIESWCMEWEYERTTKNQHRLILRRVLDEKAAAEKIRAKAEAKAKELAEKKERAEKKSERRRRRSVKWQRRGMMAARGRVMRSERRKKGDGSV